MVINFSRRVDSVRIGRWGAGAWTMWRDFLLRLTRNIRSVKVDVADDSMSDSSRGTSAVRNYSGRKRSIGSGRSSSDWTDCHSEWDRIIDDDQSAWREKFLYLLALLKDPRSLLGDTLVAEQLKLTLKWQAYLIERQLLQQTIQHKRSVQSQLNRVNFSNKRPLSFE